MTATLHIRFITALAALFILILTTGCKKNDAAQVPKPAAATAAPLDSRGRYCMRREDCPAQWEALQQKAAQVDAQAALSNHLRGLPHADPGVPDGQYVQLDSGYQLATLFYALSGMPPDYEALASAASEEYRTASHEFRKRDLLQALRPKIEQSLAKFKDPTNRYFAMQQSNVPIQHYDFKTASFPVSLNIGPTAYTYFNDAPKFTLAYNNGNDFLSFPVADEQRAKTIEAMVTKNELWSGQAIFYVFVQEADTTNNQIKGQIVRIVLKDRKQGVIARY